MMRDMRHWCTGPDGKPDFDKMAQFMDHHDRGSRFDALGWGLFFIWVGLAWLTGVGFGVGLLGVALITLGMQALRRAYGIPVEGFWIFVGCGFALAGLWHWFDLQIPLAPVILVGVGASLLFWRVWPKASRRDGKNDEST